MFAFMYLCLCVCVCLSVCLSVYLRRSYGRRIQSKIVKRCPGGIDSMPTAEQAMMRMLQVSSAFDCCLFEFTSIFF